FGIDLRALFLGYRKPVDDVDGFPDVHPGFRLERRVRREEYTVDAEESQPARSRGFGAEERRIRVEHAKENRSAGARASAAPPSDRRPRSAFRAGPTRGRRGPRSKAPSRPCDA